MRTGAASDASRAYDVATEYAATPAAALSALNGRMRAQQAQEVWEEVLETVSRAQALEVQWTSAQQSGLELSRLGAEWWLGADENSSLSRLREIARDDLLPPSSRLSAAALGMAVADNALDADSISWFYDMASALSADSDHDELTRLKCTVIFETAIGSLERAEDAGIRLLDVARRLDDPATLISALRFAHYPPRRSGNKELALERLHKSARLAERYKHPHASATISDVVAGVHLDYGEFTEAIAFTRAVTDNSTAFGGAFRQQSALDTRALAMCMLGDFEGASALVSPPSRILVRGRRRARFMSIAATLLVASHEGERELANQCLSELDDVREQLFRHSGPDIIAVAYASGLEAIRGSETAIEFARWYVKSARRDKLPLPPLLAGLAAS